MGPISENGEEEDRGGAGPTGGPRSIFHMGPELGEGT